METINVLILNERSPPIIHALTRIRPECTPLWPLSRAEGSALVEPQQIPEFERLLTIIEKFATSKDQAR